MSLTSQTTRVDPEANFKKIYPPYASFAKKYEGNPRYKENLGKQPSGNRPVRLDPKVHTRSWVPKFLKRTGGNKHKFLKQKRKTKTNKGWKRKNKTKKQKKLKKRKNKTKKY